MIENQLTICDLESQERDQEGDVFADLMNNSEMFRSLQKSISIKGESKED